MGDGYFERLATDPPAMWSLGWVADYPGRNDFLGVLLATGATNNYGALDVARVRRGDRRGDVGDRSGGGRGGLRPGRGDRPRRRPGRAGLVRAGLGADADGLLGAGQNGLGIVRMAGLAWARLMRRLLRRLLARRGCRAARSASSRRRGRGEPGDVRDADGDSTFGKGVDVQPAGDGHRGRSVGSSCC